MNDLVISENPEREEPAASAPTGAPKGLVEEANGPVERGARTAPLTASDRQDEVLVAMQALQEKVSGLASRLDQLAEAVELTARQVTFLPPQVRNLSSKVDRAVDAIGESRYQSLLLRLLGIYDLVCQNEGNLLPGYTVLRTQLSQLLEANGLSEIPTEGRFDPSLHLSVGRVACSDPDLDGKIIEVIRPGFKTEASVLRFAEVRVGYCGASAAPCGESTSPCGASTAPFVQPEEGATNG